MPEQLVGTVTHFFKGPSVAIVRLSEGEVAVGDDLHFHGHTSDFTEKVGSMEVDHVKVERATVGQEVAIQVVQRARHHLDRSEEHTSELQSRLHLVCRLLLEKKNHHRHVLHQFAGQQ